MITPKISYESVYTGESTHTHDYHVTLRMSDRCNLSCDYCVWCNGHNYGRPLETVTAIFEYLNRYGHKSVMFYIIGGEPVLHPKAIETFALMKSLGERYNIDTVVEVQTNLSYPLHRFKDVLEVVDMLSISYHFNELVRTGTHLNFVKNFCYLSVNGIQIERFDVMLEDVPEDSLDIFYKNVMWFLSHENIVDSEMIYGFFGYDGNEITKSKHLDFYGRHNRTEQITRIDGVDYTTNDLFAQGLNCIGWKCDAGTNDIMVNADGNVFVCAAEMTDYITGGKSKPLMNIIDDPNSLVSLRIKSKIRTTCSYEKCLDFYIDRSL